MTSPPSKAIPRPPALSPPEEVELERRARRLLDLYGVRDHEAVSLWRRYSDIYEFDRMMVARTEDGALAEDELVIRLAPEPRHGGIMCYTAVYRRAVVTGEVWSDRDGGRVALEKIRRRMILDDLADV